MPFESFKNESEAVVPRPVSEVGVKSMQDELQEALAAIQRGDIVVKGDQAPKPQKTEQPLILNAEFPGSSEIKVEKGFTPTRPGDDFRNTIANQAEQNDPKTQLFKMGAELRILDSKIAIQRQLAQGGQSNIKTLNELLGQRDHLVDAMNLVTKGIKEIPLSGRDQRMVNKDREDQGFLRY